MNSCNFVGRLTADPELRRTDAGIAVCSFSLAIKRPMVKDTTDFIDFVSWRQSAEYLAQYAHKGDVVAATGTLQPREWTDKEGNKRRSYEITTTSVELLSSKKNSENNQPAQNQPQGYGYQQPQQGYNPNSYERQVNAPQQTQPWFGGNTKPAFQGQVYQQPYVQIQDDDGQLPF